MLMITNIRFDGLIKCLCGFLLFFLMSSAHAVRVDISPDNVNVDEGVTVIVAVTFTEEPSDFFSSASESCGTSLFLSGTGTATFNADFTESTDGSLDFVATGIVGSTQTATVTYSIVDNDGLETDETIAATVSHGPNSSDGDFECTVSTLDTWPTITIKDTSPVAYFMDSAAGWGEVTIGENDATGSHPGGFYQLPRIEEGALDCQTKVVFDVTALDGIATLNQTTFTDVEGDLIITPVEPRSTEDITKTISATLSVNEDRCRIETTNPVSIPVTIKGVEPEEPIVITPSLIIPDPVILEGSGEFSVAKVEYALSRVIPAGDQCDIGYEVKVAGGSAVQGTHINATPENGVSTITSSDNDETYIANILDSGGGDGDKTVTLEAILTNNSTNSLCQLAGADSNNQLAISKSFTIQDDVATPLTGELTIDKTTINEGESAVVTLGLSEEVAARLAARSIESCQLAAVWTYAGSATVADYTFNAPEVITYTPGDSETAIVLKVLSDEVPEAAEFLDISVALSGAGDTPCPIATGTTSRLQRVLLQDTTEIVQVTPSLVISDPFILEGSGDYSVAKVEYALSRALPEGERCDIVYEIKVAGGSAVQGTHIDAAPSNGTSTITSSDNDETYVANILDSGSGDGDKTVTLEAVFSNNFTNSLCQLVGADSNQPLVINKSFTIQDDVATPLVGELKIDKTAINEGELAIVTLGLSEETEARLAARSIENCQLAAVWTYAGSAVVADYTFDAPEIITYTSGTPETTIELEVLSDEVAEETESLEISVALSGTGDNPCPVPTGTTSRLQDILLQDTTEVAQVEPKVEPEVLKGQTCGALRIAVGTQDIPDRAVKDQQTISALSGDNRSFYQSNCEDGDSTRNFEPEEAASQTSAVLSAAKQQLRNVRSRLDKLRSTGGERGVDVSGVNLSVQGTSIPSGLLGAAAGDEENELLANSRWGLFTNGEYGFGTNDRGVDFTEATGDRNFDFTSKGLTIGADYRFNGDKLVAGAALGYKDFSSEFTTQEGGTDTKGYNFSLYGIYLMTDKSYFDVALGVGRGSVESRRPVNNDGSGGIGNATTFAIAKPDANEVTLSIGGGYEFNSGEWTYTPYGRLDYTSGKIDAYTETASDQSASTSMFTINEQDVKSLTSTVGVKASRVISTSSGVFVPQVSVEWKHEFKGRGAISGQSVFLDENPQFGQSGFTETHSTEFDKNYFNVSAGVSAVFPKGRSAFVNVETRVGDSTIEDNAIKAGFRWEF